MLNYRLDIKMVPPKQNGAIMSIIILVVKLETRMLLFFFRREKLKLEL